VSGWGLGFPRRLPLAMVDIATWHARIGGFSCRGGVARPSAPGKTSTRPQGDGDGSRRSSFWGLAFGLAVSIFVVFLLCGFNLEANAPRAEAQTHVYCSKDAFDLYQAVSNTPGSRQIMGLPEGRYGVCAGDFGFKALIAFGWRLLSDGKAWIMPGSAAAAQAEAVALAVEESRAHFAATLADARATQERELQLKAHELQSAINSTRAAEEKMRATATEMQSKTQAADAALLAAGATADRMSQLELQCGVLQVGESLCYNLALPVVHHARRGRLRAVHQCVAA
jgi:hypothetical protein